MNKIYTLFRGTGGGDFFRNVSKVFFGCKSTVQLSLAKIKQANNWAY